MRQDSRAQSRKGRNENSKINGSRFSGVSEGLTVFDKLDPCDRCSFAAENQKNGLFRDSFLFL
ncbi:MAG: hypothetical protein CMN05_10785 [Roseibacillus sp.]|jgi:hypothetical protein|nr:hypothetical protein [Roseibacillus sp.]MBP35152.1 hypothetical protein [Roseibacillus sp.]